MSSPSVPMVSKPIYSSRATLTSTNPTPTLVYDNGDFTVFFTNVGGASLDVDVTKSLTSLNEISRLETNWNGNGAESFSSQLITKSEKHLLDRNRIYYKLLRITIKKGQETGELRDDVTTGEIVKAYALCERALLYDWCICNGEYALREYSKRMMPIFMSEFRKK